MMHDVTQTLYEGFSNTFGAYLVPWSHDLLCPVALPFPALGHELLMINLQQDIEYTSFVTQTTGIIFCAWVSCVHFLN